MLYLNAMKNSLSASEITYIKARMAADNGPGRTVATETTKHKSKGATMCHPSRHPAFTGGQSTLSYYSIHIVMYCGTLEISRFQLYTHKCSHTVMTVSFERSLSGVEIESPL
jgi:hypothetical protein